jgi:Homeodomain-like domain
MARITRAAAHLSAEEVKQRMKTAPSVLYRQRWLIIYTAQVAPRTAEKIAKECGVSQATVHALISTYNRLGIEAVETVGKGGRHVSRCSRGKKSGSYSRPSLREPSRDRLPAQGKSNARMSSALAMRYIRARSTACWRDTAGANSCPVPGTRKQIQQSKSA